MLFNSLPFIFLFLPVVLAGFFVLGRHSTAAAAAWLMLASLFFYGWWNPVYVGLLVLSMVFNYRMGLAITRALARSRARGLLIIALTADLGLLAYYKYANFFLDNLNAVLHTQASLGEIILPLGISFFTFTQIAFLVDAYQGKVREYSFVHYALFVTYFPHLIAGPILHHAEMMPQFARREIYSPDSDKIAAGLTIFVIGLFKKVMLADGIAPYVAPLYGLPGAGIAPTLLEAWCGVLAYSLQLYFDFSGYSDMAIGLSLMFGVKLPVNFHSPYKAVNIADLWNRWHMTLSRFLRDYVFVPLGGQRKSASRRYSSMLITMFLCGLWHGAGWTYIVFGILHGIYLCLNQWWRMLRKRLGQDRKRPTRLGTVIAIGVTFVAWLVGLAFFRADSVPHALQLIAGMFGFHGMALPDHWLPKWGALGTWLVANGVAFTDSRGLVTAGLVNWIVILLAITWFAPNTQQIMQRAKPALAIPRDGGYRGRLQWQPWTWSAAPLALLAIIIVTQLQKQSEFLYFQF